MSLRARLLAAFAYVLVLVIVALEVPLALNFSRRVDAEIKSEAQGPGRRARGQRVRPARGPGRASRRGPPGCRGPGGEGDRGGPGGRLIADSAGTGLGSASYASRPEIARALRGQAGQGTRHSNTLGVDVLFTAVPVVRGDAPPGPCA